MFLLDKLLFFSLFGNLGLFLLLHQLVINLMFAKSFFETACRNLVNKVSLVFQGLLLFLELLRLKFLLILLLVLHIQRFCLFNFLIELLILFLLQFSLLASLRNLLKFCFVSLELFIGKFLLELLVSLLLLLCLCHELRHVRIPPFFLPFFSHPLLFLQPLD